MLYYGHIALGTFYHAFIKNPFLLSSQILKIHYLIKTLILMFKYVII